MGVPGMGDASQKARIAAAYENSNVLTYAKDLRVPLLIIHGTSDDNVYFMHSLKMSQALFRAGKHFEFLPLAGFTHMVPDPEVTTRLYTRIAEFFVTNVANRPAAP
jgi:dipeptidyl-peptidase-4